MYLKLEDMLGPTDEARQLQYAQMQALDRYYEASHVAREAGQDTSPEMLQARDDYEKSVADLEALLGPDAHCNYVDSELWSLYSDLHKDHYNFRPRFHSTRAQTRADFERLCKTPFPVDDDIDFEVN